MSRVEQTLFLDQELDQLGTKANRGSNVESVAVFGTWNFSKSGIHRRLVVDIGIPRSPNSVKQLDLTPK